MSRGEGTWCGEEAAQELVQECEGGDEEAGHQVTDGQVQHKPGVKAGGKSARIPVAQGSEAPPLTEEDDKDCVEDDSDQESETDDDIQEDQEQEISLLQILGQEIPGLLPQSSQGRVTLPIIHL